MSRISESFEDYLNQKVYNTTLARLKNLCLNRFVWKNLPKGIEPRHIEQVLYTKGYALFLYDSSIGFWCLKGEPEGSQNLHGDYSSYKPFGFGDISQLKQSYTVDKDCVLIKNNDCCIPTEDYMELYAYELTETRRSKHVNIKAQKTPRVIACDDKNLASFKAIFSQIDGNKPAIYADTSLNLSALEVLDITAPYVVDKLDDHEHDVWNDIATFNGINNANTDKKERLITDEVNANNGFIEFSFGYMLKTRQEACDKINELFKDKLDSPITVEAREVQSSANTATSGE